MILGIIKKQWLDSQELKEQDKYLELVDKLVVVSPEPAPNEPPYYFVAGKYDRIVALLRELAVCKSYPQRTLYAVNYSLVEIPDGTTADMLKEEWLDELHSRNLV